MRPKFCRPCRRGGGRRCVSLRPAASAPAGAAPTKQAAAAGYALSQVQLGTNVARRRHQRHLADPVRAGTRRRQDLPLRRPRHCRRDHPLRVLTQLRHQRRDALQRRQRAAEPEPRRDQRQPPRRGVGGRGQPVHGAVRAGVPRHGPVRHRQPHLRRDVTPSRIGRVQMDAAGGYNNPLRYFTYNSPTAIFTGRTSLQVRATGCTSASGFSGSTTPAPNNPGTARSAGSRTCSRSTCATRTTTASPTPTTAATSAPAGIPARTPPTTRRLPPQVRRRPAQPVRHPLRPGGAVVGDRQRRRPGRRAAPHQRPALPQPRAPAQRGVYPTFATDDPGDYATARGQATDHPIKHLGQHTGSTGLEFVTSGPHAGKVLVARYGSAFDSHPFGYDVVLVDPSTQAPASHPVTTSRDDSSRSSPASAAPPPRAARPTSSPTPPARGS